jgi:hypothetical protein
MPNSSIGRLTICSIVSRGFKERYGFWKMYCRRLRLTASRWRALLDSSSPSNVIVPVQSLCRPPTEREIVVLPLPDSPTRATTSALARSKLTS